MGGVLIGDDCFQLSRTQLHAKMPTFTSYLLAAYWSVCFSVVAVLLHRNEMLRLLSHNTSVPVLYEASCWFRNTMRQLGLDLSDNDVRAMMKSVGVGPSGKVTFQGRTLRVSTGGDDDNCNLCRL